ncbi:sphingolipid C9-methyltransferase-like [Dendronephthya gigantea]|uniref:sphingolipid C9-methyltransferase-like n=1 Tax=Dendronephthya gigantea TaxID=151771 RepID=UPI00106BB914|nr:sphingolipid C9-methyltransferase-like [Dendronephthya gigantea]
MATMKNGYVSQLNGNHGLSNGFHKTTTSAIKGLPWYNVSFKALFALILGIPALILYLAHLPWWLYPVLAVVCILPIFLAFILVFNYFSMGHQTKHSRLPEFVEFRDASFGKTYESKTIPLETLIEAYADEKVDFRGDVLECFEQRENFSSFALTWNHVKIFCCNFLPELLSHTRLQDLDQVRDHYDRGNDFYEAFLGSMMIYTAGFLRRQDESLEELQTNKLNNVCDKIGLESGDRMLDIGCGWGTLVNFAAEQRGANATGVSISKNQIGYARSVTEKKQLTSKVNFMCIDYRDIPQESYDKITCLEMAEHVGVLHFQSFLCQVRDLLKDDGVFFLQIAGLRRAFQWEDFVWGLFMDKYIFPGADASCPLSFVVQQLEAAGFEVANVETVGIHYSYTIHRWYKNWVRPEVKSAICGKYGVRLYRIWEVFLAWSTIIARQGNSTCFQLVCHKNLNDYDRSKYFNIQKE